MRESAVVDGDGVHPTYDHPLVPELIQLLPALEPRGLRYILGMIDRGAARSQQANGSYEPLPIGLLEVQVREKVVTVEGDFK